MITPHCTWIVRFFSSSSRIWSSRVRQRTKHPDKGTLPPLKPVPEPRVTIGTDRCPASFTQAATSSVEPGKTTAPGRTFNAAVPSKLYGTKSSGSVST